MTLTTTCGGHQRRVVRRSAASERTVVEAFEGGHARLELPIRLPEEARLEQQPLGATIGGGLVAEPRCRVVEPLAGVVSEASDLVLEPQHLGHEPRPQQERRGMHPGRLSRTGAHQHFEDERRQPRGVDPCGAMEGVVHVVAREQPRHRERPVPTGRDVVRQRLLQRTRRCPLLREDALFEGATPSLGGGTTRHDDQGNVERAGLAADRYRRREAQDEQDPLPGVEVLGLDQANGGSHRQSPVVAGSAGGRTRAGTSARSCCRSISAPAAAADASQACCRSPLRMAARLV